MSGTDVAGQEQIVGTFVVPEIDPAAVHTLGVSEITGAVALSDIETSGGLGTGFDIYS